MGARTAFDGGVRACCPDVDGLLADGVELVLVDRDNTCVPRDAGHAPEAVTDWIARAQRAGIDVCLVSNNFHSREVRASAEELGIPCVVDHAMKPAPFALRRAMRLTGHDAAHTLMVGDQVFTDVLAGNLAGVRTVLVRPQSTSDLWYTHVFRVFEALPLRGVSFEGEGGPDPADAAE